MQNLLTAVELKDTLKVSLPAIRKWTREGMPCLRFGRLVRFDLEAVLAWMKERQESVSQ
ncbi:MAG: excisionase family DNA-binding protein [Candidatus Binatia bacterium]